VATFYAARSEIITPLPWLTFALPFSSCGRICSCRAGTRDQNLVNKSGSSRWREQLRRNDARTSLPHGSALGRAGSWGGV